MINVCMDMALKMGNVKNAQPKIVWGVQMTNVWHASRDITSTQIPIPAFFVVMPHNFVIFAINRDYVQVA